MGVLALGPVRDQRGTVFVAVLLATIAALGSPLGIALGRKEASGSLGGQGGLAVMTAAGTVLIGVIRGTDGFEFWITILIYALGVVMTAWIAVYLWGRYAASNGASD